MRLTIFYDNYCPNCTRFVKLVDKLDWLNRIQIKELRNELDTNLFPEINLELAKQQMASWSTKWYYGYDSLYFIFLRLPLFWFSIPFLYILKITKAGQIVYKELALKRKIIPMHCNAEICEI